MPEQNRPKNSVWTRHDWSRRRSRIGFTSCSWVRYSFLRRNVEVFRIHTTCRVMFWTAYTRNTYIYRSRMDGSDTSVFLTNVPRPIGLKIDFQSSRLWWTRDLTYIESSTLEGTDIKKYATLLRSSMPSQVDFFRGRAYWVLHAGRSLQSSPVSGGSIQTLHNDAGLLQNLVAVPREHLPRNRTNDCENRKCSNVCVLTPDAFSCVN